MEMKHHLLLSLPAASLSEDGLWWSFIQRKWQTAENYRRSEVLNREKIPVVLEAPKGSDMQGCALSLEAWQGLPAYEETSRDFQPGSSGHAHALEEGCSYTPEWVPGWDHSCFYLWIYSYQCQKNVLNPILSLKNFSLVDIKIFPGE